ncbi:MAG: family 1 glycosylhydrolase [Actinomycetota bacterium]|nr:family 1 glycosylhydrolase [Actinomycetota bacterium]
MATIEFIGAFESCYLPQHDIDIVETTGHDRRWRHDLALLRSCGVTRLRYPIRWHRVERAPGEYDWSATDEIFEHMGAEGFRPIVDLLHHCSYPRWLSGGFADPRFRDAYLRYCEEVASRYPWLDSYTLLNEPFTTLFLCGHEGIWPPYGRGMSAFVALARNVIPALADAARMFADALPHAQHVYVDPCEGHSAGVEESSATYAALANDRRFFVLDLLLGHHIDEDRPFFRSVMEHGGSDLLDIEPARVDVLGLDYYAHLEWSFDVNGATCPSARPQGLAALILQYAERYALPMILGETNIRGTATDRVSWLKYTLEQCEKARMLGARLDGYCWFPFIDSTDWDTLLANADSHIDPVGVYWLDENLERRPSVMSAAYTAAAAGLPADALPAFRFRSPLDRWLKGLMPQMSHWDWREPDDNELGMCDATIEIHDNWEVADVVA